LVRERVTATFGVDAVDRLYARRRGWGAAAAAGIAVRTTSDAATQAGATRRTCVCRPPRLARIDAYDLLIGLLAVEDSMAVELLRASRHRRSGHPHELEAGSGP